MVTREIKPTIQFSDFDKVDIRVGLIEKVEDIEGSEKLLRLTVDFGNFKRTILSGIKQAKKDPYTIQGKQALFVINLEPRKLMGEYSEGMLFAIGYPGEIEPQLAIPENEVPNGTVTG